MAQHDMNIANQGFPAFRADLNSALTAIANNSSGATEPSTTFAYQWWYDTSTNKLMMRNADNDAWIEIGTFNQTTDSFTPSGVTSDSIAEGNSSVEVVDSGTGYISLVLDGTEIGRFTAGSYTVKDSSGTSRGYVVGDSAGLLLASDGTNNITFDTNAAERMRINGSGNVGIGTSLPKAPLHVNSTDAFNFAAAADAGTILGAQGTGSSLIVNTPSVNTSFASGLAIDGSYDGGTAKSTINIKAFGVYSGGPYNSDLAFYTSQATALTERMRIDSSGNLLVGKTALALASVGGEIRATGQISGTRDSDLALALNRLTSDGEIAGFHKNASRVGSISVTGSSTSYNTSSDYRLKEDWQPVVNASDRVAQLKPVNFAWKSTGERVDGFLAHELQEVIPEAVTGTKDGMKTEEYEVSPAVYEDVVIPAEYDEEGNLIAEERTEQQLVTEAVMGTREVPDYQGIDQSKLVPLLTAALQDAIAKIEALEARVDALENA